MHGEINMLSSHALAKTLQKSVTSREKKLRGQADGTTGYVHRLIWKKLFFIPGPSTRDLKTYITNTDVKFILKPSRKKNGLSSKAVHQTLKSPIF